MKLIYISGPITDMPALNIHAFERAEKTMHLQGWKTFNPHKKNMHAGATWEQHMRADIKHLMDCDAIYMLCGWPDSKGAKLEHYIAESLGMYILYETQLSGVQKIQESCVEALPTAKETICHEP